FDISEEGIYRMEAYDVIGKKIKEFFINNFKPGKYRFDFSVDNLSSGVYLYRLLNDKYSSTKKLIIIK
ncbi:MAG: T9SS type A sorting domain-containing protein, partial [Ignavibacteria bacterium]|nr:T9SS type A sorting domain-containing protein [Ignavibacteria bacterium]